MRSMSDPDLIDWSEHLAQDVLERRVVLVLAYPVGILLPFGLLFAVPKAVALMVGGILWFAVIGVAAVRLTRLRCPRCACAIFDLMGPRFALFSTKRCPKCQLGFSFAGFVEQADQAKRKVNRGE